MHKCNSNLVELKLLMDERQNFFKSLPSIFCPLYKIYKRELEDPNEILNHNQCPKVFSELTASPRTSEGCKKKLLRETIILCMRSKDNAQAT